MIFQLKEIIKIVEGKLLYGEYLEDTFSISTDTRTITPENIYLPLSGTNFDGHTFINTAIEKQCKGFFIDKSHKDELSQYKQAEFVILVDNTLEAYLKLANSYRNKINPIVVAVTGSSGKTITKEILYSVLSQQFKTHKSLLNFNNEIGLCQTMLSMPQDTQILVVEMGMRGLGEIELLSKYAKPDIAIITNVGSSHIGRLGSIENIAKAKCEITSHLREKGTLIAYDDSLIKNKLKWDGKTIFYGSDFSLIKNDINGADFLYKDITYSLNVNGEYNIINSLAAIETAFICGMSIDNIKKGLKNYAPIDKRGEIQQLQNNITIINDSYNANPDSVKAAVDSFVDTYKDKNKILILGDMAELGEFEDLYHKKTGVFINDKPINTLITVGSKAKLIADTIKNNAIKVKSFNTNAETIEFLTNNISSNSAILLKASRCMAFENIFNEIRSKLK